MSKDLSVFDWEQPMTCLWGCGFEGTLREVVEHQVKKHVGKNEEECAGGDH